MGFHKLVIFIFTTLHILYLAIKILYKKLFNQNYYRGFEADQFWDEEFSRNLEEKGDDSGDSIHITKIPENTSSENSKEKEVEDIPNKDGEKER